MILVVFSYSSSSSNTGLQYVALQYLALGVQVVMVYIPGSDHGQLSLDPLQLHLRLPQQLLHVSTGLVIPHYHLRNTHTHNQRLHMLEPHCKPHTLLTPPYKLTLTKPHTHKQRQNIEMNVYTINVLWADIHAGKHEYASFIIHIKYVFEW